MWLLILGGLVLLTFAGFAFIVLKTTKFSVLRNWKHRKLSILAAAVIWILVLTVFSYLTGLWNMMVSFMHLLIFWIIIDLIFTILEKVHRKKPDSDSQQPRVQSPKPYYAGRVAILFTVGYLAVGMFFAHHVFRTSYDIQTEHASGFDSVKVVGFSDSHVGATFHANGFLKYIEQMNQENPDLVVIPGDFVDDDTSYEDMVGACEALSHLKTKYGVYYAFGNHDAGYYSKEHRGYGKKELIENLTKNNVIVMEDDIINIDKNLYICGRKDRSFSERKSMEELMQEVPKDACVIVLDHQPNDYDAEEKSQFDLVLSGHTHGGQMIPILKIGEWMGANDKTYGYEKRGLTNFIGSSGISNWALQIKTGCISEYFVINLSGK